MKKVFLSLALLSASAFSIMAQTPAQTCTDPAQCANKEQCAKVERDGKGRDSKAFEGINLSDEQKTKLAALRQGKCTAKDDKAKMAGKDGEQREKLSKEQVQQMRKERAEKHQNARKEYLVQVKEILTPDQYVVFLENCYMLQDNNGPKMNGPKMAHAAKKFDGKKMSKKGPHKMKGGAQNSETAQGND